MRESVEIIPDNGAVADLHANTMQCTATPNQGCVPQGMNEIALHAAARHTAGHAAHAAGPIYLISHNALRAEDAARQLRQAGHAVEVVERMSELLTLVALRLPSAVVVEIEHDNLTMDRLTSLVTARQASYARFPIVWISTRHHFEACLLAARAGVDFYLTLPVDFASLSERLRQLINAREGVPYRILAVTDNQARTEPYVTMLRNARMEVRRLDRLRDLLQVMDDYRPEVVVADIDLPRCRNADVSRLIRQRLTHFDVPVIFLSPDVSIEARILAAQAGADDIVAMPFDAAQLISTLQHRAERYRASRALIMRDSLTGLYNHAATKERLGHELARCVRAKVPLSFSMIDIDFFKKVNDSYGHPVGDQVIRSLSHLLRQRLRAGDVVGRYGGEEFAVILPGTPARDAAAVLDKIRDAFGLVRHEADTREFTASFSAGVADTTRLSNADELLAAADAALYEAKRQGRNRIEVG
jgi:diguanylate cyclase (GGDEF)-like protein